MRWKSKKRHMDNYREGAYKIAIWLLPILGVLDDIYAHSTGMHGIVVQEDYLTTVFSATIAVNFLNILVCNFRYFNAK